MISVGSRDEKKGLSLSYGFEGVNMETMTEIEEGEACFQSNHDDDSTIDPDISLSYIDEKIQHVLGDCQKDFECGFTVENLGAKFGGYGSFLPMYQRSPAGAHPKTPSKVLAHSAPQSPYNVHTEYPQSSASQPARKSSSTNGKQKQEVSTSCGDKSTSRSFRTSVNSLKDCDQKSLKVRIKVGSDNISTRKKAEIYSGLGLDISPSSSLEASPVNSNGYQNESPTSILEIMTSFPVSGSLVSPLPYDVLHLMEKEKGSQESGVTAVNGSDVGSKVDQDVLGELFDMAKEEAIDPVGKIWESNNTVLPIKTDSDVSIGSKILDNGIVKNESKGQKAMTLGANKTSTSSGGKRKSKGVVTVVDNGSQGGLKNESFTSKSKNLEDHKKNNGKATDTYKDFFGELDLEQEDDDDKEMGMERPSRGNNGKGTLENERTIGRTSEKPSSSTMVNGLESGVAIPMVAPPVVNEDWVCCDKCEKWRLLPPGVNPSSLPEKWLCSMLDWLPGMNRCSISEEETTKAITTHFLGPSVQASQPVHPSGPHQHLTSQIPPHVGLKKKHNSKDVQIENKQDRPSMSSNSSKKNLHTSHKSRSLNAMNNPSPLNGIEFQDSGHSRDVNRQKQKDNNTLSQNFVDEGNKNHDSKIRSKRESSQDFTKDSKKVKTDGTSHMGKNVHERDIGKKRKRADEVDANGNGTPKYVKETSESNHKEKRAKVLLNPNDNARKGKTIEDVKMRSLKDTVMAATTSSSSKVSGSHKTKINKAKGSPVGSVSSSPLQILNNNKNIVEKPPKKSLNLHEEKPKEGRNKSQGKFPSENAKTTNGQSKHHRSDVRVVQDSKKPSKNDVPEKGKPKSKSLPPRSQSQSQSQKKKEHLPQPLQEKVNGNNMPLKNNKKDENKNGNQPMKVNIKQNPTPERQKEGNYQNGPVVLVRDMSNQATTNALREATNLKHMADRAKNSGSSLESRALYMEAALKFLHVASVFESCHKETGRYGDMIQSISIYSSTAKLCEYCAHEYERTKEMSTAALAYKCMEVAYMKVIYSSHSTNTKDVNELQSSLQTGESPSSSASASDIDNLNNPKGVNVNTSQVVGNHVIAAKHKPNFTRMLNLAQDVNYAMEASRKSRIAFASVKEEAVLFAIKRALDFNFHDVEGLLHRVRVAMEVFNR